MPALPPATLVVGGTGMLGRALLALGGAQLTATHHHSSPTAADADWVPLDLHDPAAIHAVMRRVRPSVVVNAAYAREGDALEPVTAQAPGHLAEAARAVDARLVHLSSDVVFAGDRTEAYLETDHPDPVHDYGRAKAAAERRVRRAAPGALIVRTSLLYGASDGIQEQLVGRATADGIVFFTDEIRCPVHVDDLADAIARLSAAGTRGTVHLVGADAVDRLTLARALAPGIGVDPDQLCGGPSEPHTVRPRHLVLATGRDDLEGVAPLAGCRARLG